MPLAGAVLAAAAGLPADAVMEQETADGLGDRALLEHILERGPTMVAFTLYMWNVERSAWLASTLKRMRPGLITVGGGPEVTADNFWLRGSRAFDLLVAGEGERLASSVLDPVSASRIIQEAGSFIEASGPGIEPGSYPDPWLSGYLDPSRGPVHLETVRGCSGDCIYCSYRRKHPLPRIMSSERVLEILRSLALRGASEIVFLDPTFNARPDLEPLLTGMAGIGLEYFGEMRGDLIDVRIASMMKKAGFHSVEIGLQSCNPRSLVRSGRPVDPERVLDGALSLKIAGVTPVIDLMLGLPGDTPEDAIRSAVMIRDRDLHAQVQVFYTSVLPGTDLRTQEGTDYMDRPPYFRDLGPEETAFAEARERIADILEYDLDIPERPLLFEGWPGTVTLDLETCDIDSIGGTSMRLSALRIRSSDHWLSRSKLLEIVRSWREREPYCVLDLVLVPGRCFPADLVELIRECDRVSDYSSRTARHIGREGNLRIAVLVEKGSSVDPVWMAAMAGCCTVVVDSEDPFELHEDLWKAGVGVRLEGDEWDMDQLSSSVPSMHQLFFRSMVMEEIWSRAMNL